MYNQGVHHFSWYNSCSNAQTEKDNNKVVFRPGDHFMLAGENTCYFGKQNGKIFSGNFSRSASDDNNKVLPDQNLTTQA